MKRFYQTLDRFSKILFWTVCVHGLCILGFCIHHIVHPSVQKKKIIVHQVMSSTQNLQVNQRSQPKSAVLAQSVEKKKVSGVSSVKKGKVAPPNNLSVKKEGVKKVDPLLVSKIQQECKVIEKISQEGKKIEPLSLNVPKLEVSQGSLGNAVEGTFAENLSMFLQTHLELPEIGAVKVLLEISLEGKVTKVEIVEAKSKKNAEFLRNRLLDLDVSGLNDNRPLSKNYEYTIAFKNDEKLL